MSAVKPPIVGQAVAPMPDLQARLDQARSRVAYEESRKLESDRRLDAARRALLRILDLGDGPVPGAHLAGSPSDRSADVRSIAREALDIIGDPRDARARSTRPAVWRISSRGTRASMAEPITAEATYPFTVVADPEGAAALQAEVETLFGVDEVLVDADGLHVRFDADVVSDEEILATLHRAGYESPGEATA
jgi:hypothetical protein